MLQVVLDCFIVNLSLSLKNHFESLYFAHFVWAYGRCSPCTLVKRDIWSKVQLSEQHETEAGLIKPPLLPLHRPRLYRFSPAPLPHLSRATSAPFSRLHNLTGRRLGIHNFIHKFSFVSFHDYSSFCLFLYVFCLFHCSFFMLAQTRKL